jgi:hypothetical protein
MAPAWSSPREAEGPDMLIFATLQRSLLLPTSRPLTCQRVKTKMADTAYTACSICTAVCTAC